MGDSGSDDEDTSWESKWTEKQEKYKAYAVSKLQKHLAEIQEDIDKYEVKLEKLRKKGAPRSAANAPRRHPEEEGRRRRRHDGGGEEGEGARRAVGAQRPRLSREQRAYVRTSQKFARTQRAASTRRALVPTRAQ